MYVVSMTLKKVVLVLINTHPNDFYLNLPFYCLIFVTVCMQAFHKLLFYQLKNPRPRDKKLLQPNELSSSLIIPNEVFKGIIMFEDPFK